MKMTVRFFTFLFGRFIKTRRKRTTIQKQRMCFLPIKLMDSFCLCFSSLIIAKRSGSVSAKEEFKESANEEKPRDVVRRKRLREVLRSMFWISFRRVLTPKKNSQSKPSKRKAAKQSQKKIYQLVRYHEYIPVLYYYYHC